MMLRNKQVKGRGRSDRVGCRCRENVRRSRDDKYRESKARENSVDFFFFLVAEGGSVAVADKEQGSAYQSLEWGRLEGKEE